MKKLAQEDLLHYSKALEWAVSHFHNQRMKHINDIIGDMWTQIYCGNDIDTIMIKNDEEANPGELYTLSFPFLIQKTPRKVDGFNMVHE